MSWTRATLLALLTALLALSLSPEVDSAAMPSSAASAKDPQGPLGRVFMKEAEASDFFRRRSGRSAKFQDELNMGQRRALAADKLNREFHREKREEFERFAEEEADEIKERRKEQWREFH